MTTTPMCETEVLQFGRRYGFICTCRSAPALRFDTWRDAEDAAGEHEDEWRARVRRPSG